MLEPVTQQTTPVAVSRRGPIRAALVTILAAVVVLIAGPASAAGLPWWLGSGLFWGGAVVAGLGALVVAFLLLRHRSPRPLLLGALVVGLLAALIPAGLYLAASGYPRIHDISTDTADPPQFNALLASRGIGATDAAYDGPLVAAQQRVAYPDLVGVLLSQPPRAVFDRALATARARGWRIAAADQATGIIEAVATVPWWGLRDDIVIRVRPDGGGSRVDMRSKSRAGGGDDGRNAQRIRDYLAKLR